MKFRVLTLDELKELEKEFVEFLIINGIPAEDWEKMKLEDSDKAEKIIESFSDVVFSSIFRKNQFIDFIAAEEIRCFQFLEEKVVLVGVKAQGKNIDFRKSKPNDLSRQNLSVYTTDKKYKKSREEEMFELIQSGAVISNGNLFKKLCLAL